MNAKYDRLASRLDERLATVPPRGRAVRAPSRSIESGSAGVDTPPLGPTDRSSWAGAAASTVRRSHLVPASLHQRARREKVLRSANGRTTWSIVLVEGVGALLTHPNPRGLVAGLPREDEPARLVQAHLPVDLDHRFRALYLDLADDGTDVTYEQLWAASIELWLSR